MTVAGVWYPLGKSFRGIKDCGEAKPRGYRGVRSMAGANSKQYRMK